MFHLKMRQGSKDIREQSRAEQSRAEQSRAAVRRAQEHVIVSVYRSKAVPDEGVTSLCRRIECASDRIAFRDVVDVWLR